ncbi:hypothetical protein PagCFBP13532_17035 [Pantoea agglomerans]|nr:hypothetical protein PagCFBP13505_09705 [Pantoea agglomerans]TKK21349.1 hypothetical protein PagCFBP13516_06710 [Pantoea agglomerans]TKK30685.1 hypothetical protein PagCFBP13532_17035 [Pantoea agglomerans]
MAEQLKVPETSRSYQKSIKGLSSGAGRLWSQTNLKRWEHMPALGQLPHSHPTYPKVQAAYRLKAMGAYACSKASRRPDKNAGSVFEQRKALARLRAHLRDVVRNRPR